MKMGNLFKVKVKNLLHVKVGNLLQVKVENFFQMKVWGCWDLNRRNKKNNFRQVTLSLKGYNIYVNEYFASAGYPWLNDHAPDR